jgi:hypothetical protein
LDERNKTHFHFLAKYTAEALATHDIFTLFKGLPWLAIATGGKNCQIIETIFYRNSAILCAKISCMTSVLKRLDSL